MKNQKHPTTLSKSTISELDQQDLNKLMNEVLALEKMLTIQPINC
jgi:hypothetical protein